MSNPSPPEVVTFNVIHNDGWIKVRIEDGFATIEVGNINDQEVVVRAINRAIAAGAVRGTLLTGDCANDQIARMHAMRAEKGVTWRGGKVTYLGEGELGPRFRIDFDELSPIT